MIPSLSPRFVRWLSLALALPLWACTSTTSTSTAPCDLTLDTIAPPAALPGEEAVLTGHPFTSAYDTAVYVGSARATVLAVTREGCEAWDDCLEEQDCTGCDDCDACDPLREGCAESIALTVPQATAGQAGVQVFNRHGESNTLPFEVLGLPDDTGDTDTGTQDTGTQDTQDSDTGPGDTSPADTATETDTAGDTADRGETGDTTGTDTDQPGHDPGFGQSPRKRP